MAVVKKQVGKSTVKSSPSSNSLPSRVNVSLPTEKSIPCSSLSEYIILIYGEKKIGKTTLAAEFPDALMLMTEAGARSLSVYQRNLNSWDEFKGYVKLLESDKKFKTIVIDTVDLLYAMCFEYVCRKLVIAHPSEEEWGKGWQAIKEEFFKEILKISKIGKGLIFLSHATEKEVSKRDGGTYHVISPTMPKQAKEIIEGMVDIWGYYHYLGKSRYLSIAGDDHVGSGCRVKDRFRHIDGSPIELIPMPISSKSSYDSFIKAFNNKLQKEVEHESKTNVESKVVRKTVIAVKNNKHQK